MHKHPEQQPGEIYLGNSDESGESKMRMPRWGWGEDSWSGFASSNWKTKRLGNVAYYADGR